MAPGLNGRQTGTVPKNKPKNSGSQSHRSAREPYIQTPSLDWEPVPDLGHKNRTKNRGGLYHSEPEVDFVRYDLGRSRSSTMTSQNENGEGCSQDSFSSRMNLPDRKQVVTKLSQIQSYVQQTAALMNALKASETPLGRVQHDKLAVMLEDLKDSEAKLSGLLNKMDSTESRLDSLITDLEDLQGNNNVEADEEELTRRSEESKKKLEALQKRKQDLLKLQEKAKKQLQEAQAEQSRLVARASSLNQELTTNKMMDINVQQLSQRLKAVQQIYNTRNQINDSLTDNRRTNGDECEPLDEDHGEVSDTETDFQLVADKMEELNAMKAQLSQIQKLMSSMNGVPNEEGASRPRESGDDVKEQINQISLNSLGIDGGEHVGGDGNNNVMKLEQAKSKLNHLTQLLEIVQSAQNSTGLSPSYLQLVSNLVNDETNSSTHSASPARSVKSPQRNSEELSVETMQVMTRELEERTAAMKEERDRLLAAREELQNMARKHPLTKPDDLNLSADESSENEPPGLKPATLDSSTRDMLNGSGSTEAEQSTNCNDSLYVNRNSSSRSRQRGAWNASLPSSNFSTQERRCKNETLSRGSNQSSRGCSRSLGRDQSRWSPSPSVSCCNERSNPVSQTLNQLEMTGNLCELMLSDSLQRGVRSADISLQEMFNQHQMLTRTVAQCSQLIWLQQKQIIELRNAFMLQCGILPNPQWQQFASTQPQANVPIPSNPPYAGMSNGPLSNHVPSVGVQQHQNYHPVNQSAKSNAGEIPNGSIPHQEHLDQFLHLGCQTALPFATPDLFGCDWRSGNYNRSNPSHSNTNQNVNQNVTSGSNNRVPNGINCIGPEDSRALNNQVPPGNRANNYWDNFRSYSRQNLLSNTKSNEESETSRRSMTTSAQERPPREVFVPSPSQNNQSATGVSQQPPLNHGNAEPSTNDQYLLPPSQNTRANHHSQITRSRSVEPQNLRNPGKNESKHLDNDSRNFNVAGKNDGSGGGVRARNPDSAPENIRSVRNDVSQNVRNTDNLNSTRNFVHLARDFDNEEIAQGNNKKRMERTWCRNEGRGNLNNRGCNTLWENIYSEVWNFIRANQGRPHFLIQLFRDLQQVTTDNLRQRTLESIQETVNANNLTDRTSNMTGTGSGGGGSGGSGNVNIIENRNNIRENRSNLNRNQTEDPNRIDELFCHLRENQNTIRQNIGMSSFVLGGNNLENPNISNIRDLSNSRNNLENEGLRDLRTYFEANLCNFGHNSTLENPNLSNIRENLTRRGPGMSELENANPKNAYLNIYDNAAVELRRRNQEASVLHEFGSPFRNFEIGSDFATNEFPINNESVRGSNNQFELGNFEEPVVRGGGGGHFQQEHRPNPSRYPILDGGDNFVSSRPFLTNANDSGIDINFNNDERKRSFAEGETTANEGVVKTKKNEVGEVEGAAALILPQWERNEARDTSFDSSPSLSRNEMSSSFIPICENSFMNCRNFQQTDNGDLAEADQSRNEETSGAESDSGFVNLQIVEPETLFPSEQEPEASEGNFSSQNVPESERNLTEFKNCENESDIDGASAAEPEGNLAFQNSASESEGNFTRASGSSENVRKNESCEGYYYQLNASSSSESIVPKSGVKYRKRMDETAEKETCKNSTNKFRDNSLAQRKFDGLTNEDFDNQKTDSDSAASAADGCQRTESRESVAYGTFKLVLDKSVETERGNTSPEAEADWECESGLDQVPTRLNKSDSSRKSSR